MYFTLAETIRKVKSIRKKQEVARSRLFYLPRPEVDANSVVLKKAAQLNPPDPDQPGPDFTLDSSK